LTLDTCFETIETHMLATRKRLLYSTLTLLIIGASFFIGYRMGNVSGAGVPPELTVKNSLPTDNIQADFYPFWKAWQFLDEKFVPSSTSTVVTLSDQERIWGAISGMVDSLGDPYTVFLPPEEAKIFESDISGNFEGVGMEIGVRDGILTVIAPLKGTPAFRAGIKPGDKILRIDSTVTEKLNTDQAVRLIRGKVGTKVVLTVLRDKSDTPIEISVTRAVIDIPTIETELRADGIFVIRLYSFSANSPDLFRNALRDFVRTGSDKLILDLRGNPGGFLEASVDMASWFLPTGKVVVNESYRDSEEPVVHRSRGYDIFSSKLKMVVLIDRGSASAAEILAGALSEHGVAKLIGATSFGKGSVQELLRITPDSSLKVTVAQWLTPNGNSISAAGLKPDIEVIPTEDDIKNGRDPQLLSAVQFLLK